MSNYRIVTDGQGFKIQERGFLWGWNDYEEEIGWGCTAVPIFRLLLEAEIKASQLTATKKETIWVVVQEGKP